MPNGVALSVRLLLTALLSQTGWPIGLGIVAVVVSLAKYALAQPGQTESEAEDVKDMAVNSA